MMSRPYLGVRTDQQNPNHVVDDDDDDDILKYGIALEHPSNIVNH